MLSSTPSAVGADPDEGRGAVGTTAAVAAPLVDSSMAIEVGEDTEDNADDAAADASEIGADGMATLARCDTPIKAAGCSMIGNALDNEEEDEVDDEDNVLAIDAIADDSSDVGSTTASADPLCNHR